MLPCFIPSSQSLYTMIFHIFASSGIITVNILRICVYILRIVCYVRCIAVKSCTVGLFIEPFLRMLLRIAEHFVCYRTTLSQREWTSISYLVLSHSWCFSFQLRWKGSRIISHGRLENTTVAKPWWLSLWRPTKSYLEASASKVR